MDSFPSYILGFIFTAALIWFLQPVARSLGLVDHPGGRKRHKGSVPLIGGIAMYVGLVVAILAAGKPPLESILGLLAGGGLVLIVGTIDDWVDLSPFSRFLTQITAAMLMVALGEVYLHDLGYLMGESLFTLNAWAVPLTIFATVGVINAINMSDGVDGLAGGLTLISLVCLGIVAGLAGHQLFYLFAELIVVVLAFLIFNLRTPWRKKAKVFMGNGGSMFLGFVMAWSLINMSQGEHAVFSPVTALWLFAVPLMDTVCIMLRRVLKRRSPFSPDRQHFHHALLRVGYTVNQSVWIMLGLSAVLAGFGLIGHYGGVPESIMFFSFVVLFTVYFVAMNRVWRSLTTMGNRKRLQQPRRRIRQGGGANSASYKAAKRSKE